jgi:hypothetical protein
VSITAYGGDIFVAIRSQRLGVDPTLSVNSYRSSRTGEAEAKAGIGFGSALAIAISWSANKSILWAIVHGILSWIYVVYYAIRYQ